MDDNEFEENYYKFEDIELYMKLPISRKLECLEEMNRLLNALMPMKSKKIAEELRQEGW